MKKIIFVIIAVLIFITPVFAATTDDETAGKAIWDKLQAKQTTCVNLVDKDFELLGEYFMGEMTGTAHESMNQMMISTMGQSGEEQMHVVMGKRLSGCDPTAAIPLSGYSFMPMMNMMLGFGSYFGRYGMMGNFGFNNVSWWGMGLGWLLMIFFWLAVLVGVIALIKWISGGQKAQTAHDI